MDKFHFVPLSEKLILDRFLYRGKGRPRKSDYSTLSVIQKKINGLMMSYYGYITPFSFKKNEVITEWNLYGE